MNEADVLTLLVYANELDGRHSPNEMKVYAWHDVLQQGAADMPVDYARQVIKKHYATQDVMLSPAMLVKAWRDSVRFRRDAQLAQTGQHLEAHCGLRDCICTHDGNCYKGWIDGADTHTTTPCPICRTGLHDVLMRVPVPAFRSEADESLIRLRDKETL